MNGYVRTTGDNGGIHTNAGIPNHAFYLLAITLGGYSWETAGRIWYETVVDRRLEPRAQFRHFALLMSENASRLYGAKSDEVKAVQNAWKKVGVRIAKTRRKHA
jgi:Zn-dependent metalloprotease